MTFFSRTGSIFVGSAAGVDFTGLEEVDGIALTGLADSDWLFVSEK